MTTSDEFSWRQRNDRLVANPAVRSDHPAMRAVGYARVSTDEQAKSGLGLAAQYEAISREAAANGWELVAVLEDHASGKSIRKRPGLDEAIRMVADGEADALVVSKLDRLSRSVADFSTLLERFTAQRWGLVILDLGVDTRSVMGEAMANVAASFAQMERRRIGERTREGLAQARARGVRLGRPSVLESATRIRILEARTRGLSYRAIAHDLTTSRIPTAHGGRWHAETVRKIVVAANTSPRAGTVGTPVVSLLSRNALRQWP